MHTEGKPPGKIVNASFVVIFLLVFVVHFLSPTVTSLDSKWTLFISLSLLHSGDTNLDEYLNQIKIKSYRGIKNVDGHYYSMYPIGTSLLVLPMVYLCEKGVSRLLANDPQGNLFQIPGRDPWASHFAGFPVGLELFCAAIIVAFTTILLFSLCLRSGLTLKWSLFLSLVFAFATPAWSTASRALWQHGPSMLLLTTALFLLFVSNDRPSAVIPCGMILAFAYVVRPTNSIVFALFGGHLLLKNRRRFVYFSLASLIIFIPFLYYNYSIYHQLLPPYYLMPRKYGLNHRFYIALLGNLFSPGRGLFIFSPILLFSLWGSVAKVSNPHVKAVRNLCVCIVTIHWSAISLFSPGEDWWGGWSFGPRLFSDVIPFFIVLMIPVAQSLSSAFLKQHRILKGTVMAVMVCVTLWSLFVHYRGATRPETFLWNSAPASIDVSPYRLWDWHDLPFMR